MGEFYSMIYELIKISATFCSNSVGHKNTGNLPKVTLQRTMAPLYDILTFQQLISKSNRRIRESWRQDLTNSLKCMCSFLHFVKEY